MIPRIAVIASAVAAVQAAPFLGEVLTRDADVVARGADYDYVIVGGGLSGLVVANRLSSDPRK
jgi:ribulose 1,5-bisphosphate synthetase/thiazole synthase